VPTLPHPDFKGRTGNGHFADALAEIDVRAGQVLDAIDAIGIRENTIVIWMSENGPEEIYPHNGTAGPWRGTYFTALEGSLRAPFIIRWPGQIAPGQVHNEIMHITDLMPTLAHAAGASMPTDRFIDGVDQFDFLTGKTDRSARDGFPAYNGDNLMAYKWGNWKVHFLEQATMGSPVIRPGMPRIYHLLRDPKEQYDLFHYGGDDGYWVLPAIMERVVAHQMTLQEEPPIRVGTPDPYVPPRK
jgi:arylsulfatase